MLLLPLPMLIPIFLSQMLLLPLPMQFVGLLAASARVGRRMASPALACPARASGLQEAVRPWT